MPRHALRHAVLIGVLAVAAIMGASGQERPAGQGFSFRTGVELVNVTVTVTDARGRFVTGLGADDFQVIEEGQPQAISQFEAERVPVSLGIALDTSGSMLGDKIAAAQAALNRFLFDLLGPDDEVFLYRFDSKPALVHGWTSDRRAVSQALGTVKPVGGTAIYDTLAAAVPLAGLGSRRKKAIVVISDGNDTSSQTSADSVRQLIRQSEVLVYAIGIDGSGDAGRRAPGRTASTGSGQTPMPSPFPGRQAYVPPPAPAPSVGSAARRAGGSAEGLDADALRAVTDDTGGRTEVVVTPQDLDPATAGIASELSQQYFLGYVSTLPKDGRWHTIEVRVRGGDRYTVRARRGFVAG